ncbi:hypothetical protein [Blastococcus sp. Marseille-P5729]|uniref:hypothetical protein n=1 Tax=Blastococcus sp. Marseille-P5729 TaxID=2086582 RepID=UPI00131DCCF1|nr:hypothetical protein [Blastococcus sp. Marseille-P5729]
MSHPVPSPAPAPRKILTTPIIAALAALAVLAIVTVIVVVNTSDSDGGGSGSSASSAAPSSASAPAGTQVTSSTHGVRYTYPTDGYDGRTWDGPLDTELGIVEMTDLVGLRACTTEAGQDLLYGLVSSSEDPAGAAKTVAVDVAKSVWASQGDAKITDPTPAVEKSTDHELTGQLVEIDAPRPTGADECGTSKVHIATFGFENADGETVVFVASYRVDGDLSKKREEIDQDVADTFKSLELV